MMDRTWPRRAGVVAVIAAAAVAGAMLTSASADSHTARPNVVTGEEFDAYKAAQAEKDASQDAAIIDLQNRVAALEGAEPAPAPEPAPEPEPELEPQPEPDSVAPTAGPAAGLDVVFGDEFDSLDLGGAWGYSTSAYEFGTWNPNHYKRDNVVPEAMTVDNGVLTFTATRYDDFYWNTGLLTTEPTSTGGNGFRVQAGDFLVNRVQLPVGNTGAWPALWTWDGPGGEVDVFEWHSDNPHLLEFTNHVRDGSYYYTNPDLVAPGEWVWIGTKLGADSNTWYVGETLESMQPIYSDGTGIGDMRPHVIVNLSVGDNPWHADPSGDEPITYRVDTVRVYR
jgi:hypothetical protein